MKFPVIAVCSLAFWGFITFTLGEVDRYTLAIEEKGTLFSEKIEVDEKQNSEIFRVPAHNDVDGADFYHDFKKRLTVTKISARKVCYVSKMNPSLPPPGKLKADVLRAAAQSGRLPVATESHLVLVTEPTDRKLLTREILDFCGALPIYNTESIRGQAENAGNGTMKFQVDHRQKRQTPPNSDVIVRNFTSCGNFASMLKCPNAKWNLICKMKGGTCFYLVSCINMKPAKDEWSCKQVHPSNQFPVCCDFSCPK